MNLPGFPIARPRRLRISPALRRLVAETSLNVSQLVLPLFARSGKKRPAGSDPIETLRSLSLDRKGYEILNVARAALAQPYAKIQRGPVTLYEWPAFAGPPANEAEEGAQWSCVRFYDLARSLEEGRPRVMRLGFGADGVWHYFWSES